MGQQTFDLSTLFERDEVKLLDGKLVEIKNKQELGVLERRRLDSLIKKIQKSDEDASKRGVTEEELDAIAEQGSALLHDLSRIVLVEQPEKELEDWECSAIFAYWLLRSQGAADPSPPRPGKRPASRKKKTTASRKSSSSRGSKSSTAATRKRGSTTPGGS